jgi:pyruvate,water dikinase
MVIAAAGGGVETVPVPARQRDAALLSALEASVIADVMREAAKRMGVPVDVEGAWFANQCYVLQVRPITSPVGGHKLLWDNSNIVESYAGVTTPLTFSFAARSYQIVYTLFGRMLGIPHHVGEERERTAQSYLGLIQGRVYYNLLTWYESLSLMPGFGFSRGAMEGMMGVRESFEFKRKPAASQWERWTREFPHVVGMVVRILWYFATIDRLVARFDANIARNLDERAKEDYRGWESSRLVDLLEQQINTVTRRWQAPIMTDTGAMICYAVLAKLSARWVGSDASLQNDLLSGEGGIESTEPTRRLMDLARQIKGHAGACEALTTSPAAFFERLNSDPTLAAMRETLEAWLVRYGDRCMNELKLEEPSLRENPGFIAVMLRNYVQMPDLSGTDTKLGESGIRDTAQARVDEALKGHPLRRWLFNKVLGWTRKHVRNRENLRFARTRMFGVARRIFLAIGDDWVRQGVLRDRQDIFFLTMEEIIAFVDGRSVTRNMQALSDLRRAEFEAFRASEPDERFVTHGLPHTLTRYVGKAADTPAQVADLAPNELAGTPCCPGVVIQPTRLIREPGDDLRLDGEILVTPRTDPGWVTLFPAVSGLLVEKGSILSHSAIVARELGLPTIVGIKGLCAKVNQGQRVTMDGTTGRVSILEETT